MERTDKTFFKMTPPSQKKSNVKQNKKEAKRINHIQTFPEIEFFMYVFTQHMPHS